ncbi:hypothetical protein [Calothrix sp. PCC 6303]|uniref:hypothetical protein n=1 Tax=Calothrix sp. PCC 6303 TaxID=1170562 RepID=UPI0002A010D1|nr:hypothetical protein [Calothrix sp. PCC 6303]AFZ04112.1 hypothetical protein Cal6303_5226 [Calothrix sp. PCC 6303]
MEANQIISAFLEVVGTQDYVFDKQSREDLKSIEQTLIEVENQPLQVAADAIINWCKEHETIRDAVLFTAREITAKSRNPVNRETTLSNQFPEYKEKTDKQINNTQPEADQNPNQNQPAANQ